MREPIYILDGKDRRFPNLRIEEIFKYDLDTGTTVPEGSPEGSPVGNPPSPHPVLDRYCANCDFVFNLAGVNRPQNQEEFMAGNFGFASTLLDTLKKFFIVVSGHGLIQQRIISPSPALPSREGDKPWNTADSALCEQLKEHAEEMRKNPTEAEFAMWEMLRGKNLDAKFRRQHIIGDYIVDFVCLEKQLVVELDGGYHNDPE